MKDGMDSAKNYTVNKSRWRHGPWMSEPDRLQWQHAGFACLIVRNTLGNLCGYVGVDSTHPYYGKHYDSCDVSVHGGLTYAEKCGGVICHVPEPEMPHDVWWLGFDCAHSSDLVPGMPRSGTMAYSLYETYRDIEYVTAETNRLAEQLRETASIVPILGQSKHTTDHQSAEET